LVLCSPAYAQQFRIDPGTVTQDDALTGTVRLREPATGPGTLCLTWTDSYGRTVAVERREVTVDGDAVPFTLPLTRALALLNFLEGELTVGGSTVKIPRAAFHVTPSPATWDDYVVIMYYPYRRTQQQLALRDCGVTSGRITGRRTLDRAKMWWANDYRYYCDQIVCEYYAPYHTPRQRPKWKLLLDAQAAYLADRSSKEPFIRKPCLLDPKARADAMEKMRRAAQTHIRFKPLFYATDECGVGNLSAAWDFCYDPRTLAAMRTWLIGQYGSLEAINREWGTTFARLDDVVPLTTDETMARGDHNFSSWTDHRHFMNKCFADAVKAGADAVKSVDPSGLTGLLGAQAPSAFGGYDYWLLSQAMDMIEPYNIGNNREIWRSLAPRKPAVTTGFGRGRQEIWRLWYQALHGDLGLIIYDERRRYLDRQAQPTATALRVEPTYRELTDGIVKQLWAMKRINDPIAIHYSQPSITAHWMLEHLPDGPAWAEMHPERNRRDSPFMRTRESWARVLEDLWLGYTFVAYGQLENGDFDRMGVRVMVLPQSIALSDKECQALRRFVARGGTLIADCRTGLMDRHGRMLQRGQLDDLFGVTRGDVRFKPGPTGLKPTADGGQRARSLERLAAAEPALRPASGAIVLFKDADGTPAVIVNRTGKGKTVYLNAAVTDYHRWRMKPPEGDAFRSFVGETLADAGMRPRFSLSAADDAPAYAAEMHVFRGGVMQIVGVHRNYQIRTGELGPPEYHRQPALEGPLQLTMDLGKPYAVYEQRTGAFLGKRSTVTFALDRLQPTLFTLLPEPVTALEVTAPAEAAVGEVIQARLRLTGPALGDVHVFRLRVLGPDGKELRILTQSVLAPRGEAVAAFPLALSDAKGAYVLQVRDVATGTKAEHRLAVK